MSNEVKPPSAPAPRSWSQRKDTSRAQQASATRDALIMAGRRLFAERGYHEVNVRDLTASAGVTPGALAHHFGGKEDLFLAVFHAVEQELTAASANSAAKGGAWDRFRAGIQHYLDAVLRPDIQRITLIDAPVVLGWSRWRKLEESYSLGALEAVLEIAMSDGVIRRQPVATLAHLIFGCIMEAALLIAHSDDPARLRQEAGLTLETLLGGLE